MHPRKVQYLSRIPMSAAEEKAAALKAKEAAKAAASGDESESDSDNATDGASTTPGTRDNEDITGQPEPESPVKLSQKLLARNELSKKVQTNFSLRMVLLPIVAALAMAVYKVKVDGVKFNPRALLSITNSSSKFSPGMFDFVGSKYASDVVHITTRKLLPEDDAALCAGWTPQIVSHEHGHVEAALLHADTLRQENKVLLLLNGHDTGLYYHWNKESDDCLHALTTAAATALGADPDYFPNGLRLYNSMGNPIATAAELDVERLAYILTDFQIWVWPGVRVGYVRRIENVTMTTISLSPLVFDCEGFFTLDEANAIIEYGSKSLSRSPVDSPDAVDGYHADRTSNTAFLADNRFTRDFRHRSARLARLPSPSFVERMQLVRYEAGQFFRKHEDYFESKDFLGKKNEALKDYKTWAEWAARQIDTLMEERRQDADSADDTSSVVPSMFQPGGPLYPNPSDKVTWQIEWLKLFLEESERTNFFEDKADVDWGKWIIENVENRAHGIVDILLESRGYMLPYMIQAWEKKSGLPSLKYNIPKGPVSGVTHYFRWIRWLKERIQDLGEAAPPHVRPTGTDYPSFRSKFQTKLARYILEDHSVEELTALWGSSEWAEWLVAHEKDTDVILDGARQFVPIFHAAVDAWTRRTGASDVAELFAYTPPVHVEHFEPNRFVTLFLYLNDVEEGGETVFPYSKERLVTNIERQGMDECSEGLAVPPKKLHMSLFYGQTWDNKLEPKSLHGGCPPAKGVKFGANSFTWNADADEGSNAWGFGG
ncbi:hypothetical protein H310_09296 [Aphanomyces invadans]|uniref:Prolyl 4-hydroxylase alpha subunit domain-containing protein n=1 Tax=Aphanomyces invadans TaxID=157072 RepID=A0A024TXD4_9STRA|nr:hypothetical protein H310_09296 [Aphanomyces invadans]ETV97992.1 hypothetical protein H310_09296 [Aphanomyces invadans]|eukprot:XP_008873553.1 hypothetical protein H310_09296 [Aphanomyces invadans]